MMGEIKTSIDENTRRYDKLEISFDSRRISLGNNQK